MKSIMIGFRVSESVNSKLRELADKRGVTVSAYVKAKVEDFVNRVDNTIKPVNTTKEEYVVIGGQRFKKTT